MMLYDFQHSLTQSSLSRISITEGAVSVIGLECYDDFVIEWLQESVGGVLNLDVWMKETKILWML